MDSSPSLTSNYLGALDMYVSLWNMSISSVNYSGPWTRNTSIPQTGIALTVCELGILLDHCVHSTFYLAFFI